MCWGYIVWFGAGVSDLHRNVLNTTQWQLLISRQTFMWSAVNQYRLGTTSYINCVGTRVEFGLNESLCWAWSLPSRTWSFPSNQKN